jgi:hypothetical protein
MSEMAAKSKVDWDAPTERQVARSLRLVRSLMVYSAVAAVVMAGICIAIGMTVVGVALLAVDAVCTPFAWHEVNKRHAELRAKAVPDDPFAS